MGRVVQLLVFSLVVIYSSYMYLYFFNTGITSFKPLFWHYLTIIFSLTLILARLPSVQLEIPRSLLFWFLVFLSDSIISFFSSPQDEIAVQALTESFMITALLFSFLAIFHIEGSIHNIQKAFLLVVLLAVFMNIMDFATPMWSKIPGRAAGFFENPTISGKMLVFAMVASIPLIPNKLRLIFCFLVGIGVFITFSRGPWMFWVIALIGLATTGYINFGQKKVTVLAAILVAGFFVYGAATGRIFDILVVFGVDEYLTSGTLVRVGGSGAVFSDYSTTTRVAAAERAWAVFAENPWFGAGLGIDQGWEVGAHNTYLRMAIEGGVFRLAIFLGLIVILFRTTNNLGKIILVVYAASCFTSQDNLRQPALLLILAFTNILNSNRDSKTISEIDDKLVKNAVYTRL